MQGLPAEAALWRDRLLDKQSAEAPSGRVETDPKRIKAFFAGTKHDVGG